MNKKLSFRRFIETTVKLPCDFFAILVLGVLAVVGAYCNSISENPLPMLEILATGFTVIVCIVDYSVKQLYKFCTTVQETVTDSTLLLIFEKLEERMYSNKNLLIALVLPAGIVPAVGRMLGCPLSLPVKVYTYTGLYIILAWCFVGYALYVNFIWMLRECLKGAKQITSYNKECPDKTDWVVAMKEQAYLYDRLFFLAGVGFMALLCFIMGSGFYGVDVVEGVSAMATTYLWLIVFVFIILAFMFFSICGDTYITRITYKLKKLANSQ